MSSCFDSSVIFTTTAGLRLRCFLSAAQIVKFGRRVLPTGKLHEGAL
jgi:hypothetical protein